MYLTESALKEQLRFLACNQLHQSSPIAGNDFTLKAKFKFVQKLINITNAMLLWSPPQRNASLFGLSSTRPATSLFRLSSTRPAASSTSATVRRHFAVNPRRCPACNTRDSRDAARGSLGTVLFSIFSLPQPLCFSFTVPCPLFIS